METSDLQKLVESVSLEYFERPFKHKASFNNRLRTTGGRYHLASHDLDFNPKVLEKLGEETLIGIIKHELCHYHLHLEGKGSRHKDREFKDLLKKVGGLRFVPSMNAQKKAVDYWKYQCKKCGSTALRQRRFNTTKFVCAKCKGKFELVGKQVKNRTTVD